MEVKIDHELIETLRTFGTAGFIAFIILFLIYHWEKIEKFVTFFAKLLTGIFKSGQSELTRLALQSQLNQGITQLDNEAPGLFEKSVKVSWLETGTEHINANRKGVFIRVNKAEDIDSLFLKSIDFLFENALLVNSRPYIHGHLLESIKLVLGEKVITRAGLQSALIAYRKEKYNPAILKDRSISRAVNKFEFLDYRGLFTRVFLRECVDLHLRTGIGHQGVKAKWDIARFLEFANDLFRKLDQEGVRASFEYSSDTLNIAFAILADEFTWAISGLEFYKKRTRLSIQRGANTIYIIGLGTRNIKLANNLGIWLQTQGFLGRKFFSYYNLTYGKINSVSAICIRCEIQPHAKGLSAEQETTLDPEIVINDETLHQVIKSVVQDSDITIIKSAWLKGYMAQVVVNSNNPRKKPLQICIGKEAVTAKEISRLAGDYVRFIEWSPDLRGAIVNNLDNHDHSEVREVTLDPTNRFAYVQVNSGKTIRDLIGKDGKTLKLAEALTEYSIEIQIDPKSEIANQLKRIIPEIASGEITILDMAILKDEEVRILVTSRKHESPAMVCGGYLEERKIQTNISEWIYFCNKKDNIFDAIVAALYPLRNEDVVDVRQETPTKFTVVVKDKDAMARGIGIEGVHVRAASRLLNVWIQLALAEEKKL